MKKLLLLMIVLGLLSNLGASAQSGGAGGSAGTASGSAGGGTASAVTAAGGETAQRVPVMTGQANVQTRTPSRPAPPANLMVQSQNTTLPSQQLLQQQQALRQRQILQAQQAQTAAMRQSGASQISPVQSTLVPNAGPQLGQAAQPPQVGIATGLSASPSAAAQPSAPGVVPQNTVGAANSTAANLQANPSNPANPGIVSNGAGGLVGNLSTNGVGAVVPATVGTLAAAPTGVAGVPAGPITNANLAAQPVQPTPNLRLPAIVPLQRPPKPTLAIADLPEDVQKVLKAQLGEGSLYSLEQTKSNRGDSYRAAFKNGNKYREMVIAQDGTVVSDSGDTPAVMAATVPTPPQSTRLTDLPLAVRNAINAYGAASEIQNIQLVPSGDSSVYSVRVDHGGKASDLEIAKDGRVIRNVAVDPFALPAGANIATMAAGAAPGNVSGTALHIPLAVSNTMAAQSGGAEVKDIQLSHANGTNIYNIETIRNGALSHLQIAEDGRIVNGQGLAISLSDLPDKVQSKVKDEVGGAVISGIQKEARDGKTIYDVRYNSNKGRDTDLLLAEDGTIVPNSKGIQLEASGAPAQPAASHLQLADLPKPARKAIQDEAGTAPIDDITIRTSKGQVVYSAKFKKDDESKRVDVDENGTILSGNK